MSTQKWSKLSGVGLFGLFSVLAACGEAPSGAVQQEASQHVGSIEAALEDPLRKCEQDQATCIGAAKDPTAALACNDSFRSCLGEAAKQGEQSATDLEQCREGAAQCVLKAGPTGATMCRGEYEKCIGSVTGAPTPGQPVAGAPSLPQLPLGGRRAPRLPVGGGRAFPGLPFPLAGAPGGVFPRLPFAGAPALPQGGRVSLPGPRANENAGKCFVDLRECVRTPGKDPNQCAADARKCLEGAPTGAGGAGGKAD